MCFISVFSPLAVVLFSPLYSGGDNCLLLKSLDFFFAKELPVFKEKANIPGADLNYFRFVFLSLFLSYAVGTSHA